MRILVLASGKPLVVGESEIFSSPRREKYPRKSYPKSGIYLYILLTCYLSFQHLSSPPPPLANLGGEYIPLLKPTKTAKGCIMLKDTHRLPVK